ncbi:MAG: gamma-glutamyl-gamma-aminobutyrate hydrolase family protein, partial [Clostridiales bacterium]|nr:gamma-glutamyl-gamma-aminobutyrate hydrolase family protein [Clostridiales bacterium]
GICRGAQIMNVAFGGSLYQDLAAQRQDAKPIAHQQKMPSKNPVHQVEIQKNSLLHTIVNQNSIKVNSFHHQGVKTVGKGLTATAYASCGLIEAIEWTDHPFFLGVEWHPEKMPQDPSAYEIFNHFIKACR